MMKRTGVARLDEPSPLPQSPAVIQQQAGASNMHTLAQTAQPQIIARDSGRVFAAGQTMVSVGTGFPRARAPAPPAPPVINYVKPGALQYAAPKQPQMMPARKPEPVQPVFRGAALASPAPAPPAAPPANTQFQRLKVEDALSYLDQVKFKFNTQPQVYNDFLDIMKEFKSQTIDTPGVITRVSNLFKGHPELIVGFNTFLPPGYKIEVQSNGQVSVSMPSPTALGAAGLVLGVHHNPQPQLVHLLPVPQSVGNTLVHNLSVTPAPAPPQNTLHHISQAHQQIEAAAIHHAGAAGGVQAGASQHAAAAPPGQPVEFNHAIEYVNKIKSRFSRQPDKYKRFLEILHAYQRGHRDLKQPQAKQQTEQEVYSQVAKLFENQDDLLLEFGQFLPDAKGGAAAAAAAAAAGKFAPATPPPPPPPPPLHSVVFTTHSQQHQREEPERYAAPTPEPLQPPPQHAPPPQTGKLPAATSAPAHHHLKRSPSFTSSGQMTSGPPAAKKPRPSALTGATVRDVSYAEAAKFGTMNEYSYFDKVRKALSNQQVYDNFLRCLLLYTNEIISSSELLLVTAPFLCRHAELQRWLQDFVAPASPPPTPPEPHASYIAFQPSAGSLLSLERELDGVKPRARYEPLGALAAQLRHDRPQGDAAMDIDLTTCKRLGTSYCALPRGSAEAASRRCSGRTPLCKEVLNDTWVSFPTWSEESTFVTSRKTQYEEYIYRCEDERFELDVVIETNAATIRVLEGVQKKLSRMSSEDAARHRLDDCLGGHSPTVHQRALKRIYGDKAVDIIAGLKKNPAVAVPVVLRRLKAKEEEWREAQKGFNKQWREQNEKYYLKSLDHQGINFKQNDLKALRSKSLFNEVESAFSAGKPGPHVYVDYNMKSRQEAIKIVRDAADLLIHHARRQTAIQKAEKRRIKQLLRQFLPDLFNHPRQPPSDDERDDEEKEAVGSPGSPAGERERADSGGGERDKSRGSSVKLEKQESSESDNGSDKSAKHNKNNKENTPKNNNNTESKENIAIPAHIGVKRSSSSDDMKDIKSDTEIEDDYRDHPPNEARFVCTSSWYLFLRLHSALCRRLAGARAAALQLHAASAPPAAAAAAARLHLRNTNLPPEARSAADYYPALLALVKGVLDGNTEPSAFEDAAREMLGIRAYPAYTLDKIVSYAVRQLQHCVSDPWSVRAAELCARGGMRAGAGYLRRAARALRDQHATFLVRAYGGDECKLTFELLEAPGEGRSSPQLNNESARLSPTSQRPLGNGATDTSAVARCLNWSLYSERYSERLLSAAPASAPPANALTAGKPVFLMRNARRCGADATTNSAGSTTSCTTSSLVPRRRKQLQDCSLAARLRLLAARPHAGYRRGALRKARDMQPRLHALRRKRLRDWLQAKCLSVSVSVCGMITHTLSHKE